MVTVRLERLTKRFGKVIAVNDINLTIPHGKFTVILGPSGCGKTTLLRLIAGLEQPTTGNVYFDEKLVTDIPPDKRNVAMVFQVPVLYPHMKVYDNIAFCLRNRNVPEPEIKKKVYDVARLLEVEDLLDRWPHQLSGGQQQRIAIARALVREPAAFLLDEPLANLDARLKEAIRVELKRLHDKVRGTFIYVTHDQVEAMSLADYIAVMNKGRIIQFGPPTEIYDNPVNEFVAGFIGTPPMNMVRGTLRVVDDEVRFVSPDFTYTLPEQIQEKLKGLNIDGKEVKFGFRPRDVVVASDGELVSEVVLVEHMGDEEIIRVKIGNTLLCVCAAGRMDVKPADRLKLTIGDKIYLFDARTTENLLLQVPKE